MSVLMSRGTIVQLEMVTLYLQTICKMNYSDTEKLQFQTGENQSDFFFVIGYGAEYMSFVGWILERDLPEQEPVNFPEVIKFD